jgi:hypothetical protein
VTLPEKPEVGTVRASSSVRRFLMSVDKEVQDVLDQIAASITAGDGETVADLWETPGFVIGPSMALVLNSRAECAKMFSGGKEQYNAKGISDTRAEVLGLEWIGNDVVIAKVRWPYLDKKGREIGGERSDYTFRRDGEGTLKVREVLMRGEEAK